MKNAIEKIREIIFKLENNIELNFDEVFIIKNISEEEFNMLRDFLSTDDFQKYKHVSEFN